jgi:hypothetical protein
MDIIITKYPLADVVIGVAPVGEVFLAYPLTACCGASGKGGGNGVICRKCYRDVDPMYGDCAPLYSVPGGWPIEKIIGGWTDAPDSVIAELVATWRAEGKVGG